MTFFTFICCKNCLVCLKRPKINKKEAWVGPIFLKKSCSAKVLQHRSQTKCFSRGAKPQNEKLFAVQVKSLEEIFLCKTDSFTLWNVFSIVHCLWQQQQQPALPCPALSWTLQEFSNFWKMVSRRPSYSVRKAPNEADKEKTLYLTPEQTTSLLFQN